MSQISSLFIGIVIKQAVKALQLPVCAALPGPVTHFLPGLKLAQQSNLRVNSAQFKSVTVTDHFMNECDPSQIEVSEC